MGHSTLLGRLAALALIASALALGVEAGCTAGYLKLDLVSAGSSECGANLHALCLASFRIGIDANCNVALTPLFGSGVYVPGIWSSNPADTYTRLVGCPSWTTTAVDPDPTSNDATPTQLKDAIKTAMQRHVYGSSYELGISGMAWSNGTVTATTVAGSCSLKYAITEVSPTATSYAIDIGSDAVRAECDVEGMLVDGTECQMASGDNCPLGKRPVSLAAGRACALCRAGAYSPNGSGCTACAAGRFVKSVGASSCASQCAAGSYAAGGNSECLPCNPGTYQDATGQGTCDPCPYRSYAKLPGATLCVRCVAGIAKCVTGIAAGCDASNNEAPSAGYQVLSVTSSSTLSTAACALGAQLFFANLLLAGQCTLSPSGSTFLSVYVDQYCGVQISPIKDTACAEPAAAYWSSLKIKGQYVSPALIATSLNTAVTNSTSSYLLTLEAASGTTLTLSYWPATTDVSQAATVSASTKVCSGTLGVVGGQVAGVPTTAVDPCPAGSYDSSDAVDGCRPCPIGSVCPAASSGPTKCLADQFQPYLGQGSTACQTCNAAAVPRYTTEAGDDYCLVPWVDTDCTDGFEYDAVTTTCSICPAGTARKIGRENFCVPCLPGYYSAAGATDCVSCPVNQYAPMYGLAQSTVGDLKCLYCPGGSVAATDAGDVGSLGSTTCNPCAPGTAASVAPPLLFATCNACPDGYYRPGDASSGNNICLLIPSGYKEKARADTSYDRAEIERCIKGQVSYWTGNTRTPSNPEACQPCLNTNKYAPRRGMTSCQACRAGTQPGNSGTGSVGNDICTPCTGNTYRPISSSSSTCLVCTAGREVQGSGSAACQPCIPGFYMPDIDGGTNTSRPAASDSCTPCPINSYQAESGKPSCIQCPAGSSTQDTGNIECHPCPDGYYSPNAATACIPAPKGTFVNITGAATYTFCPAGTFGNDVAMDVCDVCGAGQYSNSPGSTSCKTCSAGNYSGAKAASCKKCGAGYYSFPGSYACSPCKPGSFSSFAGTAVCTPCVLGSQCPTSAMRSPQPCPRGYFSNKQGSRLCKPCPPNSYQALTGQQSCLTCSTGQTTRGLTGQSACQYNRSNRSTAT